ncbi:hypothetical protein BC833DRAFT_395853 [Globomyces pollinis-pini]|nr:hypothetical protein BC833DRAFT_395853 [Globomyces pollinis-pini]
MLLISNVGINQIGQLCGDRTSEQFNNIILSSTNTITVSFKSDRYGTDKGFKIKFEIIDREVACNQDLDCAGHGKCVLNQCICDSGYSGIVCNSKSTLFTPYTPRQKHGVTLDPINDMVYITFGEDWNTVYSDMITYNFVTMEWKLIDQSKWGLSPAPRYKHTTWWFNSTLYVFGGIGSDIIFTDLWSYKPNTNQWISIKTNPPYFFNRVYEPTITFIDLGYKFKLIWLCGRVLNSNGYCYSIYEYDSELNLWTKLGNSPVSYIGGQTIYHPFTKSIKLLSGYPFEDRYYSGTGQLYVLDYSVESSAWNPIAPRSKTLSRYEGDILYLPSEHGVVYGGMSPGTFDSCFQNNIQILDVACNQWLDIQSTIAPPRLGHGMIYRNNSLYIFGGSDGTLYNDMVQVPFEISLPTETARESCRAKTYCSNIQTCDSCSQKSYCKWCNGACGYKNETMYPQNSTLVKVPIKGDLIDGYCPTNAEQSICSAVPSLSINQSYIASVKYGSYIDLSLDATAYQTNYITVSLTENQNPLKDINLRLTVLNTIPYSTTILGKTLKLQEILLVYNIRVSWGNNNGLFVMDSLMDQYDENSQWIDQTATFSIQVNLGAISPATPNIQNGSITDTLLILAIFAMFALSGGITIYSHIRRAMRLNRQRQEGIELNEIRAPIPDLYHYRLDIANSRFDLSKTKQNTIPLSVENLGTLRGLKETQMTAISVIILLPGTEKFLQQQLIPSFGIGTYISKVRKEQKDKNKVTNQVILKSQPLN